MFLLVISFVLPYLPPSTFPTLSVLSLAVSPLILLNIFFAIYWLIRMKKRFVPSALVVVIAYFHFNSFFQFSSEGDPDEFQHTLSVMSFNVRLFNAYEKNPEPDAVADSFSELLTTHQPDIVCIQEYYSKQQVDFSAYPHRFVHFKDSSQALGHAIFSKYPIVNQGGFDFQKSYNNTIFADIQVGNDTVRVYNLHLQSLGILPSVDFLQQRGTERIQKRISETFVIQEQQASTILNHKEKSSYPALLVGDFNNTPFSYTYRILKEGMQDAYMKRGHALGTTYWFNIYPMRIDFIFGDAKMETLKFEVGSKSFSDHKPIFAHFGWN